jgi:acetolactate synthase small subunit
LARVILLFHGRRIEFDSLVAGPAQRPDVLQIEVAFECNQDGARLIEAALYKLASVLLVEENHRDRETADQATGDGQGESLWSSM